eukprot:PhM_4_TR18735/c0_g1_i5/m.65868/K06182/rluF; 23S rRNA pseudouridine2604 synthase
MSSDSHHNNQTTAVGSSPSVVNVVRYLMDKYGTPHSASSASSIEQQHHSLFPFLLTRKLIHALIASGSISINNRVLSTEDAEVAGMYDVDRERGDVVTISPDAVEALQNGIRVWVYNKPEGIDCNLVARDKRSLIHVLNKLKEGEDGKNNNDNIFPVGRLDRDSCGMLLLTNSGALCERLLHPSFVHEKEYYVEIDKSPPVPTRFMDLLRTGVTWTSTSSKKTKQTVVEQSDPCHVEEVAMSSPNSQQRPRTCFTITLTQGMHRQIRNMVEAAGAQYISELPPSEIQPGQGRFWVRKLKRIRYGPLKLCDVMMETEKERTDNDGLPMIVELKDEPLKKGKKQEMIGLIQKREIGKKKSNNWIIERN